MQFIADFTVNIEGVGDVCSFSIFDFQRHGNVNYASPHNALRSQRSSQGKMEKSFLSFQSSYPSWQPNDQGMKFLTTLRTFRDQKLQGSPPRTCQRSPLLRERNVRNSYLRREGLHNSPGQGHHMGSLWLIETDPKSHPYLLDWFYSSGPHQIPDNTLDCPTVVIDVDNEKGKEIWKRPFQNEVTPTEDWPDFFENRSTTHLQASTSYPFFREESMLHHNNTSTVIPPTRIHWWARGGPGGVRDHTETSFLEPPEFRNRGGSHRASFLDDRVQASFIEPPELTQRGGPQQSSFFEPREFTHRGGPQQASFYELPAFNHHAGSQHAASFIDPTEFNHQLAEGGSDSHSYNSVNEYEEEQPLDWRNYHDLSRTTYPEEFGGSSEGFKLLFDDVYKPSETLTVNSNSEDDLVE